MGVNNEVMLWILDNDKTYKFVAALKSICKSLVVQGYPEYVRRILLYSKGLPLGKSKNGIPDYDVRPMIITDALIRIVDKLIYHNVPKEIRKTAMGTFQMIGERSACELGTIATKFGLEFIRDIDGNAQQRCH